MRLADERDSLALVRVATMSPLSWSVTRSRFSRTDDASLMLPERSSTSRMVGDPTRYATEIRLARVARCSLSVARSLVKRAVSASSCAVSACRCVRNATSSLLSTCHRASTGARRTWTAWMRALSRDTSVVSTPSRARASRARCSTWLRLPAPSDRLTTPTATSEVATRAIAPIFRRNVTRRSTQRSARPLPDDWQGSSTDVH